MKTTSVRTDCGFTLHAIEGTLPVLEEIWSAHTYDRDLPLERGTTVVDVGANQGFFSLYAASKGAVVYSFEPEAHNFEILERNIEANHLQERVHAFQLALGKSNGARTMYVPEEDVELGAVMVTASRRLSERMVHGRAHRVRMLYATLEKALTQIGVPTIDLLKLDCEGAELEILASAPAARFQSIRNIVMETHCTYTDKAVVHRLLDLGYHIVRLRKMDGRFGVGFIAASRSPPAAPSPPAAIIAAPNHVPVASPLVVRATKSFATRRNVRPLTFTWTVDGTPTSERWRQISTTFSSPGQHTIALEVSDGEQSDRELKVIWAMIPDYESHPHPIPLGAASVKTRHHVSKEQHFVIAKESYPRLWAPRRLMISVHRSDTRTQSLYRFNGSVVPLKHEYTEVYVDRFPSDLDCRFAIEVVDEQDVTVCWWGIP